MNPITIEFFHDTICSFCFSISPRMRRLKEMMPDVAIVHRSFALVPREEDFIRLFGSRAAAKGEILKHWQEANANDDEHRFNIAGMANSDFPFPTSMNALLACKAAAFLGGEDAYWDVFDALQTAFFVQNQNIEDVAVIRAVVEQCGLDGAQWARRFADADADTAAAVAADLARAAAYGIDSVPTLVLNGTHLLSGAQPLEAIIAAVRSVSAGA